MQGQVLSLASAGEFLFSGGHDGTIAVWKFDPATQTFIAAVSPQTRAALWVDMAAHPIPSMCCTAQRGDGFYELPLLEYIVSPEAPAGCCAVFKHALMCPMELAPGFGSTVRAFRLSGMTCFCVQIPNLSPLSQRSPKLRVAGWVFEGLAELCAQAALSAAQGGHALGVQSMVTISQPHQFLLSGDWEGNIKVCLHARAEHLM